MDGRAQDFWWQVGQLRLGGLRRFQAGGRSQATPKVQQQR